MNRVTSIDHIAPATDLPSATGTSGGQIFATIPAGLCLFWHLPSGSKAPFIADHFSGGRPVPSQRYTSSSVGKARALTSVA